MANEAPTAAVAIDPTPATDRLRRRFGRIARAAMHLLSGGVTAVDADARWHLAQLPLIGLTMLAPRRSPVVAAPDDGFRPVVFVHGLGGARGNFLPMLAWLRLRGRRRLYAWGPPSGQSVEALAGALPAFVDEVLARNGLPPDAQVDLVAHSMGGLVARCALEDPTFSCRVATLVTLGTPHGGSHAARWLATRDHLALRPDSPLIQRLARAAAGTTRLICFWSRADVLLLPSSTARVDGAEAHEVVGATHYGYLLRPDCWRIVHDALAPAPVACPR